MRRWALLRELTAERFGPLFEVTREAPPTAAEIVRRRRVLLGLPAASTPEAIAARRAVLLGTRPSTEPEYFATRPVDNRVSGFGAMHASRSEALLGEED